ncbi:MAG: hypothetical protein IJG82_09415 [Atopobiaceae bacterium]|nr:hypothetical protein [Atopobiaceae bacterium]
MTVWEKLFGTPERTAQTLEGMDQIDVCYWMDDVNIGKLPPEKCEGCLFEYDRYGCERKDMTDLDWLRMEVER